MAANSETEGERTGLQSVNQADRQVQGKTDRQADWLVQVDTHREESQKKTERQLVTERESSKWNAD